MGRDQAEQEYVEYVTARLPALRRLAYVLSGDSHRADDLVQQTITTLFVRWSKIRQADHLDRYVRSMLVNTFIDERRLAWAKVRLFAEPPQSVAPEPDSVEDRSVLRAALARVPRRQRAVLVLRFIYDLPVTEVADMLGVSTGTVKSQTSHGLTALRRLLDEQTVAALSDAQER
ncbi:SigE family RNA polymerase sigma factor [Dactylosporangium fulvum]|uniref:SigE family RNA polymerase sigma factor n=1 Tax=Dactylosporangium fulvum TaxID=53359 RepID=A0ABY5VXX3_9ACTN|nr:SigE family RNA polymerase sigma factor [Dactylosporangium fulvum]UWP82480.1 SigE family RNA polymerase sigma factor [Dactylosporangium fulvum]